MLLTNSKPANRPMWGQIKEPADPSPKKTRFLFVYPSVMMENFFDLPASGWTNTWHYLGFSILSSCLKTHKFQVELVDFRDLEGWHEFEEIINKTEADVAMLTAATMLFPRVKKIAGIIKNLRPDIKTVIGGVHVSLRPQDGLDFPHFDHVVKGEGEAASLNIGYAMERGEAIPRLIRGDIPTLGDLPFPDRSLFKRKEDPGFFFMERPHATLITSRGCPYKCSFCQPATNDVFGGKVRQRPVDDVMEELTLLHGADMKSIRFLDDLFMINQYWIQEFIDKYRAKNFKFQLICQARSDIIVKRENLVRQLKEIGMDVIHIGFESASDRVLDFLHKDNTEAKNTDALRICNELGITPFVNFIFGSPGETVEDMQKTIDALNEHRIRFRGGNVLFPTIGTELHGQLTEQDQIGGEITFLHSNIDSILEMNDYAEKLEKGFIKDVDYNLVKKCLDRALTLDFEDNPEVKAELRELLAKTPRILFIHPDDFSPLVPIIMKVIANLDPHIEVDGIFPKYISLTEEMKSRFHHLYVYDPLFKTESDMGDAFREFGLAPYGAVMTPVVGEPFYVGWNATSAAAAFMLSQVEADHWGYMDHKMCFNGVKKEILDSVGSYEAKAPFEASGSYLFNEKSRAAFMESSTNNLKTFVRIARNIAAASHRGIDWNTSKIMFFGAGGRLNQTLTHYPHLVEEVEVLGIMDNDRAKQGQTFAGLPIHPVDYLSTANPDLVVITSMYSPEILRQLGEFSLVNEVNYRAVIA